MTTNLEIGLSIQTGAFRTNYHDTGAPAGSADGTTGKAVLLLHGSGPGVSAWANWRNQLAPFAERHRVVAPDLVGFGYTEIRDDQEYSREVWLRQIVDLLDALEIERVHVVGNSFGGSMALALAINHPERVAKVVLMGAAGVPFEITEGLDAVWGYEPSEEAMGRLMRETFAYDSSFITDELVASRYAASTRPGTMEAFASMFPAPRQRWVEALAHPEEAIRGMTAPTLVVHGRDDKVIPLSTSLTLLDWIDNSRLHVFGRCGHWTQIEHAAAFNELVLDFLA